MHAYPMLLDPRFTKSVRLAGLMIVSIRTLNVPFCFIADSFLTATCYGKPFVSKLSIPKMCCVRLHNRLNSEQNRVSTIDSILSRIESIVETHITQFWNRQF